MRKYVPLDVCVLLPPSQYVYVDMQCVYVLEIRQIRQVGLCRTACEHVCVFVYACVLP